MIRVTVELISARTGNTTKLAEMHISNDGTSTNHRIGHYTGRVLRGPNFTSIQRIGEVRDHRRKELSIWYLIAKMLKSMDYSK